MKSYHPSSLATATIPYNTSQMRLLMKIGHHINTAKNKKKDKNVNLNSFRTATKVAGFWEANGIRKALEVLKEQPITIHKKNQADLNLTLIDRYDHGGLMGNATIYITPQTIEFFQDLSEGFTQYDLTCASSLSTAGLIRMYWYSCQFKDKKLIHLPMATAHRMLMPHKEYHADSRRRLNSKIKEYQVKLEERCDTYFKINQVLKLGKELTGWAIEPKVKDIKEKPIVKESSLQFKRLTDNFGLTPQQARKVENVIKSSPQASHKINFIMYETEEGYQEGMIKNKSAYLIKVLRRHYVKLSTL